MFQASPDLLYETSAMCARTHACRNPLVGCRFGPPTVLGNQLEQHCDWPFARVCAVKSNRSYSTRVGRTSSQDSPRKSCTTCSASTRSLTLPPCDRHLSSSNAESAVTP